jgi:hypothetical protein
VLLTRDQLTIYLQDHRAGAQFGLELARRVRDATEDDDPKLHSFLGKLADEIEEDLGSLDSIMDQLDVAKDRVKIVGGWTMEKLGRLKLNGRLFERAPLSTVLELEGLLGGVEGKLGLWRSLLEIAPTDSRLDVAELERLEARAQKQIRGLRVHHKIAAREAFAAEAAGASA